VKVVEHGRGGPKISAVGIGTWEWGASSWGYGKDYTKEDLRKVFKKAKDLGINFFDTAEAYGQSESMLGEALASEGREGLVIATKVMPQNATYGGTLRAADKSLRRLGLKCVDLYQLHYPNPLFGLGGAMRAFDELYLDGKIAMAGVSNFGLNGVIEARDLLKSARLVSDQVQYNLLERGPEKELLPYLQKEGMMLIAYSPLAQGLLSGHFPRRPKDLIRAMNPYYSGSNLNSIRQLIEVLDRVAKARGVTVTQVSLNWLISKDVVVPIVGAKRESHVVEIAGAVGWSLSQSESMEIDETVKRVRTSKTMGYLTAPFRVLQLLVSGK
jgi:aryl-alcohol dehydrogenase-like predicted oxidoreductase